MRRQNSYVANAKGNAEMVKMIVSVVRERLRGGRLRGEKSVRGERSVRGSRLRDDELGEEEEEGGRGAGVRDEG